MPKYIDADRLIMFRVSNDPVVIAVNVAPAADVQEVRHGKWKTIIDSNGVVEGWLHEECGRQVTSKDEYCPKCGAKMDEDGE